MEPFLCSNVMTPDAELYLVLLVAALQQCPEPRMLWLCSSLCTVKFTHVCKPENKRWWNGWRMRPPSVKWCEKLLLLLNNFRHAKKHSKETNHSVCFKFSGKMLHTNSWHFVWMVFLGGGGLGFFLESTNNYKQSKKLPQNLKMSPEDSSDLAAYMRDTWNGSHNHRGDCVMNVVQNPYFPHVFSETF